MAETKRPHKCVCRKRPRRWCINHWLETFNPVTGKPRLVREFAGPEPKAGRR